MTNISKADKEVIKKLYFSIIEGENTTVTAKETPSTATNSAVDEKVVKMHKTDKGNLSQRGKIPTLLFNKLIEGDKDTKIMKSFPKKDDNGNAVQYNGKDQWVNFIPSENISRFVTEAEGLGISIEYV